MNMKKWILALALILPGIVSAQQWSGIIDPTRASPAWQNAGVEGGIPSGSWAACVTAQCNTVAGGTVTPASVQAAINSAPANTVVNVPAGNFTWNTGIILKSNMAVRGAGANQTIITITGGSTACDGYPSAAVCLSASSGEGPTPDPNTEQNLCDLTSGYSQGSTTITLSNCGSTTPALGSISNLKVGNIVWLDQLDDISDAGQIFDCLNSTSEGGPQCSNNGTGSGGGARSDGPTIACASCSGGVMKWRSRAQVVTVTQCDGNSTPGHACASGTNITISPGLYMPNWRSGQKPQAVYATTDLVFAGIENLALLNVNTAGDRGIIFQSAKNCWVKGVKSTFAGRDHVMFGYVQHVTVQDSYFYQSTSHSSVSYGTEVEWAGSDILVQNNIYQQVTDSTPNCNGGCSGNVFAYNFDINNIFLTAGWMQGGLYQHASGDSYNLWEGNISPGYEADDVHGTHHFETVFRNRLYGNQAAGCGGAGVNTCNAQTIPVDAYAASRYMNYIGNVLGQAGYHNTYTASCTVDNSCFSNNTAIYRFGQTGSGGGTNDNGFCVNFPTCSSHDHYDPQTTTYAMRWGNYDTVNGNSCNASANCAAGIRFVSGEVPSGLSLYANAVPASQVLPASFYLSSKPSWWDSSPFPGIGPDVTGGNDANSGGHSNMNPAGDCYLNVMGGPADGTGSVLTFNANNCYGSTPTAATPSCAPGSGTYSGTQSVTCSDASAGAIMCWTLDGSTPATNGTTGCANGTLYSGAISISVSETLKVVGGGTGYLDGSVVSYAYVISGGATVPSSIGNGVTISNGVIIR